MQDMHALSWQQQGTLDQMQDAGVKNTSSFKIRSLIRDKARDYESHPSTDVYCQKTLVNLGGIVKYMAGGQRQMKRDIHI